MLRFAARGRQGAAARPRALAPPGLAGWARAGNNPCWTPRRGFAIAVQPTLEERAQEYRDRHASASRVPVAEEIQHMTVVSMPQLSPSMKSATITRWLLNVGDEFESGELFVEVTTDSLLDHGSEVFGMEIESWEDGHAARILAPEGSVVKPGDPIALMVDHERDLTEWEDASTDLAGVPAAAYTRRFAWQAYIMEETVGMGGCGPK